MELSRRVKDFESISGWCEPIGNGYQNRVSEIQKKGVNGKSLISFTVGDPFVGGIRTPDFINEELIHAAHGRWNGYGPYMGPTIRRLTEAIAHREKCVQNISYPPDNIFPTPGAMVGITILNWCLMNPEDEWLALEPIYEYYWWQHNLTPFKWVPWKSDEEQGWKPDLDELRSKITEKSKGILMVSPNNPTGAVYNDKILKGIVDIAGEHNLLIISDQVMDLLCHNGEVATSIASVADDVPCLMLNSFSKSMVTPGWRVGWLLLHDPEGKADNLKKGINKFPRSWVGMMPTVIQVAAASVLERVTDFQSHLREGMELIKKRKAYTMKRLEEIEGISIVEMKAGYWGFPKVDGIGKIWKDDYDFAWQLLEEEAISILPGPNWGSTYGPQHFRAPLLHPITILEEAYNRIDSFIRRHSK